VGREELDINNHLNNVVYAGWALETVPKTVAEQSRLADLEIVFRSEAFYGETVVARSSIMADAAHDTYLHQIVRAEDGLELARLISRWQPEVAEH
jgi:acyl-ACP thioesterase